LPGATQFHAGLAKEGLINMACVGHGEYRSEG
jgi:hypothetical protein